MPAIDDVVVEPPSKSHCEANAATMFWLANRKQASSHPSAARGRTREWRIDLVGFFMGFNALIPYDTWMVIIKPPPSCISTLLFVVWCPI